MAVMPTAAEITAEWQALAEQSGVVYLATEGEDGPLASYAPFVRDQDGALLILISALAGHHRNLRRHPRAGVLITENAAQAANVFALRRLQLDVRAEPLARDEVPRDAAVAALRTRFGKFVDTLDGLGDFTVFRLWPVSGSYVRGFAQTWRLSGEGLAVATPVGARQASED
ncbi:pyridoxamine 5'-phosphate oxidase family protein [Granulosicoccaceae sp. 1_MG-2023]|nr:pyridoxamine 5'-phosphate oxidase family protein [Granulosicoccaceae sp. 1_MG-2023]